MASKYLDKIRKEECKKFHPNKLPKDRFDRYDWYVNKQMPFAYVTGKGDKFAGTIHYSKKIGYYWMVGDSSNCYKINPDGSLGENVTYKKK